MLVNILFPFDEILLCDYTRSYISPEKKSKSIKGSLFFILASLLFVVVGSSSPYAKLLLVSPSIVGFILGIVLIVSQDYKTMHLGSVFIALSLSSFTLAIIIPLAFTNISFLTACSVMKIVTPAYIFLLLVGYRLHFYNQVKNGSAQKHIPWSDAYSAIVIVSGITLSKAVSQSILSFLLCLVWLVIHLVMSSVLLDYRKLCRSIDAECSR